MVDFIIDRHAQQAFVRTPYGVIKSPTTPQGHDQVESRSESTWEYESKLGQIAPEELIKFQDEG